MFNKKYKDEIKQLKDENDMLQKQRDLLKETLKRYDSLSGKLKQFENLDNAIYQSTERLSDIEECIVAQSIELKNIENELIGCRRASIEQTLEFYQTNFKYNDSDEYKRRLNDNIDAQKRTVRDGGAIVKPASGEVMFNGKKGGGNNIVNTISDLMLIAFNSYCNQLIDNAKAYNCDKHKSSIINKAEKLSRMGKNLKIYISEDYIAMKIEQLEIQVWYKEILEREKEEKRIQREMLKEQEAIDRELERDRIKLQAEKEKYEAILSNEKNEEKVSDLQTALEDVSNRIENNEYKLKNKKYGYLYVVSAHDMKDGMIKIGCTRRENVETRISELSNASHAFKFDLHCSVFSEDVFTLEANMHRYFKDRRVNLANYRKEFFYVNCNEVKEALMSFGHDVEMNKNPENEQYLLSERMRGRK